MEILHQVFITIVAAFMFFIVIAKFVSPMTNDGKDDHRRHEFTNVVTEEFKSTKEKSVSRRKSMKKVRFAVDHDESVVNQVISDLSETKQAVFEKNHDAVVSVVKSPEEKSTDQTEDGEHELVDRRMIGEENVRDREEIQMCLKLVCDDVIDEDEKEKEGLISDEEDSEDDEDWEGVERSDLEKVFAMAAHYGKLQDQLQSLGSDVRMQLYGLHKVATEGPCHESPPMALKVSARAKWNAWQKLGNMNPDVAMEQYISLLSETFPGWSQGIHPDSVGVDLSSSSTASTLDESQKEMKSEIEPCFDDGDLPGISNSLNEVKH